MDRNDIERPRKLRVPTAIPVKITSPSDNRTLMACTLDVSREGARLSSAGELLKNGDILTIQYQNQRAQFRVVWVSDPTSPAKGQFGVQSLETGRHFWQEKRLENAYSILGMN
jgi:PilZ domain-containing protein